MADFTHEFHMKIERSQLRVGTDTLADAFGDSVYIAARGAEVECPVCGTWCSEYHERFQCDCGAQFAARVQGRWAAVDIYELLPMSEQFFLPRAWNPEPPYISAADLRALYETFTNERELCRIKLDHVDAE